LVIRSGKPLEILIIK